MSKKFLYFFDQYQKKSLLLLFCFMFVATVLEMIGLGFIFTIVGALGSVNIKNNTEISLEILLFQDITWEYQLILQHTHWALSI